MSSPRRDAGQAAVETLAVLPALVLLALVAWAVARGAHSWVRAEGAARAAARAEAVGGPAEAAAGRALPRALAGRARVWRVLEAGGGATWRVAVPVTVLPGRPPAVVEGRAEADR